VTFEDSAPGAIQVHDLAANRGMFEHESL
jgi:hypothetical protein